jgi:serine/threonine protein kinase
MPLENDPIGKFQVLATLGKGANSSILHIRRSKDSKQYALKIVPISDKDDQKYLEQANHEFRVSRMLDHPNLIKVYNLETQKDWLFRVRKVLMLIEYVNGETLNKVKGLTLPRLAQVFFRVADGLAHMHRRGVYHADLKPNNIMLSKAGEVKIIDYGLAWIKGEPKDRVQGTPEYIAPESVKHSLVNERTDIYNFGATMYRLVTWRHTPNCMVPVEGMRMNSQVFATLFKPVQEYNAEAPAALCDLIHRCVSYKASNRPERMSEIRDTLKNIAKSLVKKPEDRLEAMEW